MAPRGTPGQRNQRGDRRLRREDQPRNRFFSIIGPLMDRYRRYVSPRAPPGCSDLATKQAPSPRKAPEKQPTRPTGHSGSSTFAS